MTLSTQGATSLLLSLTILGSAPTLAQTENEFVPLFESDSLMEWSLQETEANFFTLTDGVLTVQGNKGWLRSPRVYADFTLQMQVRFTSVNADSGFFFRAGSDTPFIFGWPGDAYQVQIRDISENQSDRPLPLANLYRHSIAEGQTDYEKQRVLALYTGLNQWQQLEISVLGDQLTVQLNGELVNSSQDIINANGYIGFQSETGTIEYKDIMIMEL